MQLSYGRVVYQQTLSLYRLKPERYLLILRELKPFVLQLKQCLDPEFSQLRAALPFDFIAHHLTSPNNAQLLNFSSSSHRGG